MKWFKHDSDSHTDAKLKKVLIKYGARGYGLYWYCLECIAKDVDETNLTFELEQDSEIIAHDLGMDSAVVEEIMNFMVSLNLFQESSGRIACLKMLKRLDASMTGNKQMREMIIKAKENHDEVMTDHDPIMTGSEKVMLEEIRLDKNITTKAPPVEKVPFQEIVSAYHEILPTLPAMKLQTANRKKVLAARWKTSDKTKSIEWWREFFTVVSNTPFLMGKNDRGWKADFDFLITESKFAGILEGKYEGVGK